MTWTLRKAGLLSPKTLQNRIVRQHAQMDDPGRLIANDVFPLVELSSSKETYFTQNGLRSGMQRTGLASESPISSVEDLGENDVTVDTYKEKISPEKAVNTELNTEQEILNLFNAISDALLEDLLMTRSLISWRGDDKVDGVIGADGVSAHPDIPTTHVFTPGTAYSDTANATPITDFINADTEINEDGRKLGQAGPRTAYMSPRVLQDLRLNKDIQSQYQNIRALTADQLADEFEVERIQVVRTQVPRRDANGNLVDDAGNVVAEPKDAATDNILEPYNGGANVRNIVISHPGQETAFCPWFLDRLAEHAAGAPPSGDFSVDNTRGYATQTWTTNDPVVSWMKIMQEVGFHVLHGGNMVVIQDI